MQCKKALEEAAGDLAQAEVILRRHSAASAEKKADRELAAGAIGSYVHDGAVGAMVLLSCETDFVARNDDFKALAREIAMHVAATAPLSLNTDDLDPAAIEKERTVLTEKAKEEGRPEAMIAKIVEGQINKFQKDVVLSKQPFVMDPDVTIEQLVANSAKELGSSNLHLAGFVRLALGEGVESEVASMMGGN